MLRYPAICAWGMCICICEKLRKLVDVLSSHFGFDVMGVSETFRAAFISARRYLQHGRLNACER